MVIGAGMTSAIMNPCRPQEMEAVHAANVLAVVSLIFAAGIFTGVLTGTKMIEAMASAAVSVIPESMGGWLPLIVAVTSMPLSLVFTPDAYYFGVMPLIVRVFAVVMRRFMRASGAESLNVAASIFMGQTEAPLTIRPFGPRNSIAPARPARAPTSVRSS